MEMCPFCDLVENGLPSHAIYEDNEFFVLLDRQSVAFGHCMVLPKKHVDLIYEMEDSEYVSLLLLSKKLANIIESHLKVKAVSYLAHGAGVRHVHLHLIPLKHGDEVVNPQKYMKRRSDVQLKHDAERLIAKLPNLEEALAN